MISSPYKIECELGEITTTSHKLNAKGQSSYDSGAEFFAPTASREKFKSNRFMELSLDFSTDMSDRKAAERLNRIRNESHGILPTTYRNTMEREGQKIQQCIEAKCATALLQNGFNAEGEYLDDSGFKPDKSIYIDHDMVREAADALELPSYNISDYESPEHAVNVSVDDVFVKKQTEKRPKAVDAEQPKRVANTVIHVQKGGGSYILNGSTLIGTLKQLIGFLLCCGLLGRQLVFFTDGARDLHSAIPKMFSFLNYKIILDWYHLKKKCQEQLSMALKGSKVRNEFLDKLLPCLWFGNISKAILLLKNIDQEKVKNHEITVKLIEYLERVRGFIPCYALRKQLGLRNSSNLGEKSNDLVVANRQKHNGMSWSKDGSVAFASVSSAVYNNEIVLWVNNHDLAFNLVEVSSPGQIAA